MQFGMTLVIIWRVCLCKNWLVILNYFSNHSEKLWNTYMKCEIHDFLTDICHNSYPPIEKYRIATHFSPPSSKWEQFKTMGWAYIWEVSFLLTHQENRQQNTRKHLDRDKIKQVFMLGVQNHRTNERVLWDTIREKNLSMSGPWTHPLHSWRFGCLGWWPTEIVQLRTACVSGDVSHKFHAQSWRLNSA